jgi:hypothetical protein
MLRAQGHQPHPSISPTGLVQSMSKQVITYYNNCLHYSNTLLYYDQDTLFLFTLPRYYCTTTTPITTKNNTTILLGTRIQGALYGELLGSITRFSTCFLPVFYLITQRERHSVRMFSNRLCIASDNSVLNQIGSFEIFSYILMAPAFRPGTFFFGVCFQSVRWSFRLSEVRRLIPLFPELLL